MEITFDLKGKSLGRAASEAAILLRGKNRPDFEPRVRPVHKVKILNVEKLAVHPAELKKIPMKDLFAKNPKEVFRRAVWGMLPKNRSRKHIMKNLVFEK